jgi:hypothetical protein
VRMLDPHPHLAEDLFSDAIVATEAALAVKVADLQVLARD